MSCDFDTHKVLLHGPDKKVQLVKYSKVIGIVLQVFYISKHILENYSNVFLIDIEQLHMHHIWTYNFNK